MNRNLCSILLMLCASSCASRDNPLSLASEQQASMEKKVLVYVNDYRNSKNLRPLVPSEQVAQLARTHSREMQRKNKIDHKGFPARVSKVRNHFPRTFVSENVGFNYGYKIPEKRMVDSWINSPSHRSNILGNYRYTGISVSQSAEGNFFFTQLFVSP